MSLRLIEAHFALNLCIELICRLPVGAIACVVDLLFGRLEAEHLDRHGPGAIRNLWKRVTASWIRSGDDFLIALRSDYGRTGYRLVCGFYKSALTMEYGARGAKQQEEY